MSEWCAVGIIPGYRDGGTLLKLPFDLGAGVSLQPVPGWVSGDRGSELALIRKYFADSLGARDAQWRGDTPRSIQDAVDTQLALAGLAAWLAKPTRLFADQVMHFETPGEGSSLRRSVDGQSIALHPYDQDNRLEMPDLELARLLFSRMGQLPGDGAVGAALRATCAALREPAWGTRFVLLWVALEALFGSAAPQEAAYRMAQRAALFVAESRALRRQVFDAVLGSYWARCRAVHGTRLTGLDAAESCDLSYQAQEWLRSALGRILQDAALTAKVDGREREAFLDTGLFD